MRWAVFFALTTSLMGMSATWCWLERAASCPVAKEVKAEP